MEDVFCPYCSALCKIYWQETAVWHCSNCDLLFRHPQPDGQFLKAHYEAGWREPEHQIISGATDSALAEVYVKRILNELNISNFQKTQVLEFGAGTGEMVTAVANCGANATAIEPFGLDYLQQKGILVFPDLDSLPEMQFDGIYTIQVVEHLTKPWETLIELYHCLKPGGWLYVSTIHAKSLNSKLSRGNWREAQNPSHLYFFTPTNLEKLLNDAGYEHVRQITSSIPYPHKKIGARQLTQISQKLNLGGELCFIARRPQ